MTDIVSPATRSRMMSSIRAKNSKGELAIRSALFARGYRYRLHRRDLPGTPDLCFVRQRAVIFFHGCFWHRHGCALFKSPKSNADFWQRKLKRNVENDRAAKTRLRRAGWRVLEVWECALRGPHRFNKRALIDRVERWLVRGTRSAQVPVRARPR